ncbi:hypothetical protein [Marinoscillum furvescens]|uniref:Uncharacterized protein n=1 Tax=Marinoscillum furvescens DSM 4134 TaxID=1122208 RepID=A0A3D9L4N7_MARFU|nr:hypothetical protein [Marinoscillum furvescens]REE00479.1 hypothetical protein C7460_105102 [Marinoscillum furvescens DSM 4134]
MRKLLALAVTLSAALTFTACEEDGGTVIEEKEVLEGGIGVAVNSDITSNTTWSSDSIYILQSRIVVESGATLTIEPGTIVKGEAGSGANATALIVARGGKLMAKGTATKPIIFTSVADKITLGQVASPNLSNDLVGLWGGVIILGNASGSFKGNVESFQIEGIPADDTRGLYGGTVEDDYSGEITYISIRHGGSNIGEGNEINGLTLGGVGSKTLISHVEVVANQDDGIECFGGSVDVSNAIVWNVGDDAYDMDQDYKGTIDNFIFIGGDQTDHAMELDGPEGDATDAMFTLKNGSLKGWNDDGEGGGEYIDFRSNVRAKIADSYFFNFSADSDVELDNEGVATNYVDGKIIMTGLQFDVSHLSEGNLSVADIFVDKSDAKDAFSRAQLDATNQVVTTATVGADKSAFSGWTWADASGELSDF